MKNQVIKNETRETGKKIIEYWKSRGIDTRGLKGIKCAENNDICIYYGIINDCFNNYDVSVVKANDVEIIELPKEKTFPREMLVWDGFEDDAIKAIVLCKLDFKNIINPYIVVMNHHEENYKNGDTFEWTYYKNAKELPEVNEEKEELLKKADELIQKANELKAAAEKL